MGTARRHPVGRGDPGPVAALQRARCGPLRTVRIDGLHVVSRAAPRGARGRLALPAEQTRGKVSLKRGLAPEGVSDGVWKPLPPAPSPKRRGGAEAVLLPLSA